MKIRTKLMILSLGGILVTVVTLATVLQIRRGALGRDLQGELDANARAQCASIAHDVHTMLCVQHESVTQKVNSDLNVARECLKHAGQVEFLNENVTWNAVNQVTKQAVRVELPKMSVGGTWLGQNTDLSVTSPVVDKVKSLVGGTCTIFQRMNEAGDMLRVCTNVVAADGNRAVGTYIPATNPDGLVNPVISTVMKGERYVGRAFVVKDWCVTAYEPIFDAQHKVVGVLYVGVKQESVDELRRGIMDIVVGKTGYVFVLGGSGDQRGRYVVSHDGSRDGENIWEAKDDDGHLFIQSIINKALATRNGECDYERYPWKNADDTHARHKIAAVTYFEPWDWVIGAGTYEDDFHDARARLETALNTLVFWVFLAAVVILVVAGVISVLAAKGITRPLIAVTQGLKDIAQGEGNLTLRLEASTRDEVGELATWFNTFIEKLQHIILNIADNARTLAGAATELSTTANHLASGAEETTVQSDSVTSAAGQMSANMTTMAAASEQMTANVQTVASSVEEMTCSISEIAKSAEQASSVAGNAANLAVASSQGIAELGKAADEIGDVIATIQDIAEQTNLLALNATIEAARAGDAGKGFAVVATEVKELAKQTAEATETIRARIEGIQGSTGKAIESINRVSAVIQQVNDVSKTIASAVEEQSITTREIAQNVAQTSDAAVSVASGVSESAAASQEIVTNITGVNQAARETAQGASNVQQVGGELSRLAEELSGLVGQFTV